MSERVEYVVLCVDGAPACLPFGSGGRQDAIEMCALHDLKHGPYCGPHRVVKRTITEEVIHADR